LNIPRVARVFAIGTGLLTLCWQLVQGVNGIFPHRFTIAEIVAGVFLVGTGLMRSSPNSDRALLCSLCFTSGVFSVATGSLLVEPVEPGPIVATFAMLFCLAFALALSQAKSQTTSN
jgi:hypothetical protein